MVFSNYKGSKGTKYSVFAFWDSTTKRLPLTFVGGSSKRIDYPASSSNSNDSSSIPSAEGTATIPAEIFNLVKNIVGAGVLSLPAGIAAFGDAPSALIPAICLIVGIGILSAFSFSLLGRICHHTGATSYRSAWSKTIGEKSSIIPAVSSLLMTFSAVLAYSMILADTFQKLFKTVGISATRSNTLFAVTGFVLLPLCLLRDLNSLAPFSLLGILGMGYTAIAMAIRYMGNAYLPGGFLADAVPTHPHFGTVGAEGAFSPSISLLVCMLSTAFMAHFNAPKFYCELKNNTMTRFNVVVSVSFGISIAIFVAVAGLGFLTFGSTSAGLILNNYATTDTLISIARLAVAASIVFSYPLAFVGVRDGVLDMIQIPQEARTNEALNKLTIAILSVVTVMALNLTALSFVLSFTGATMGNALIYIYPAIMFQKMVKNQKRIGKLNHLVQSELMLSQASAVLGVCMGVVGTITAMTSITR